MAKIIKKGRQLEEKYLAIEQERNNRSEEAVKKFCKFAICSIVIWSIFAVISVVIDIFSITLIVITICLEIGLIIALFGHMNIDILSDTTDTDILASGISGERIATKILSKLPDGYTIFQNVTINYDGKTSEIDNIVVGRSGVFIVETKNHNGSIAGNYEEAYWTQYKVGRGGTPYEKEIYSPIKQVGTHIYRLANYLRQSGANTYIEGMVYFTHEECEVRITGSGPISVYTSFNNDEALLYRRILEGEHRLSIESIKHICKLLSQL
ncbi:MAG: NERD domain-containing protein [Blautia sp.]|nr:NERD domain-containing protein [Lachnoclostridium sp.]MCM1211384.1 NERD domain-containing protein [Blautia sp.]